MPPKPTIQKINEKLDNALSNLMKKDAFLLENDVSERAISHRLGVYLENEFPEWNVDCEYNLKGIDTKRLGGIQECEQHKTDRVNPDIIVHKRDSDENILVIEIKKEKQDDCDIRKLELFTDPNGEYKYILGGHIILKKGQEPNKIFFIEGAEKLAAGNWKRPLSRKTGYDPRIRKRPGSDSN